jgi:hypothetical protein
MRGAYYLTISLIISAILLSLQPGRAFAQQLTRIRTTYYDAAHTQRRAVYSILLRGARPDTVAHGTYRRFWRGGSLEELGHFTNGQADSIWTRYYPAAAGQVPVLARRLLLRDGQPDGPFVVRHLDGRVAQRGTFRRGHLIDSLVTTTERGQPRLLARFGSSQVPGLRGSFQQWRSRYTARPLGLGWLDHQHQGLSDNNSYPTHDTARYWTGQLAAGRLVGAFTEHDADGEPRVRLSYTAQGQWRLTTLYYPAVWLRNEQERDEPLPPDSVVHSRPLYQWQTVGSYLLQQYWSFYYSNTDNLANTQLFEIVPYSRNKEHHYTSDIIGSLDRPLIPAPLPANIAAAFLQPVPNKPRLSCSGLGLQYVTYGRPPLWSVTLANGLVLRRYPPLSQYRSPTTLQAVRHPGRWRLGEADTTGTSHRPAQQRETRLADGRRMVERAHTVRTYFATGKLQSFEKHRFLGGTLDCDYYSSGGRKEVVSRGWLGTYSRGWDEAGHITKREYKSPLDKQAINKLRNSLKRAHPWRTVKRKLHQFRPMRPVYRAFRRVFPRHDHHIPRPRKG